MNQPKAHSLRLFTFNVQFLICYAPLLVVLLVALLLRLPYLEIVGHNDITRYNTTWIEAIQQHGVFQIYRQTDSYNYPPLYLPMLALIGAVWTPPEVTLTFVVLHKCFSILAELALIGVVYNWLPPGKRIRWLIPLLLALHPGLIVTSAFWGQIDSLWMLFLVLALIALNQGKPLWSWGWFALAALTKFPALVTAPLLLVLTFRRYGLRQTAFSLALFTGVMAATLVPFLLGSGLSALRPFTSAVDVEPATTGWAFNLWYSVIPTIWGARPPLVYDTVLNSDLLLGALSYKQVGLLLFAVYGLHILVSAWRSSAERREFVWMAALYFGFFMLPTQVHERYLYPAAVFILIALAQERRLWPVALGVCFTYSYNVVVPTHAPFVWLGVNWLFTLGDITLHVALLNLALFTWTTKIAVLPESPSTDAGTLWGRRLLQRVGIVTVLALMLAVLIPVLTPDRLPAGTTPLEARFGESIRLEGYHLNRDGDTWRLTLYWRAEAHTNMDYTVFVHAARDGATVAQNDERPQGGAYPTWRWYHHRLVRTTHRLVLSEGGLPDALYVGLYEAATVINASLIQDGQSVPDGRAVIWQLEN